MVQRTEIRLAGTGGQGMILAGILLAEAALRDGKQVTQTQSYGPEARGGASRAEVVIADEPIDYPRVTEADVLLALSQEACDKYFYGLRRGGLLIVDSEKVTRTPTTRAVRVPITSLAIQNTGREITANVVGLGLLVGLIDLVSRGSLEEAIAARTPKGTQELNMKALAAGFEAAAQIRSA